MNETTFLAFGDELVKIAFFQTVRNGFTSALKEGWHGTTNEKNTWFGKGRQITPGMSRLSRMGEEFTSLGGATKALPVGAKSLMALGTYSAARQALNPVDSTGLQRSRTERLGGLAGNTTGGLIGSAIGNRLMPGMLGSIGGGIIGGKIGEGIATSPFKLLRGNKNQPMQSPYPNEAYQGASV